VRQRDVSSTPGAVTSADHEPGAPGRRTLSEPFPPAPVVQRRPSLAVAAAADGLRTAADDVPGQVAADGLAGASEPLPHRDRIQAAFGRHDVGGIRVASDARAHDASAQLGAHAYAAGDRVALPGGPDLFTEAHEATHVVQQRAGRVSAHGRAGDTHEQQADDVASRVVRGESVEGVLDALAPGGGPGGAPHVQLRINVTSAQVVAQWGHAAGGAPYNDLRGALDRYNAAADDPLATPDRLRSTVRVVIANAEAFRDSFLPGQPPPQVGNHLNNLLTAAITELDTIMNASVTAARANAAPGEADPARAAAARGEAEIARLTPGVGAPHGDPRDAARRKILRYQQQLGFAGTRCDDLAAAGPAVAQNWTARGDMYHVGATIGLFPELNVVIYDLPDPATIGPADARLPAMAARWEQACLLAGYYSQPARVFYTFLDGVAGHSNPGAAYEFHASLTAGAPAAARRPLFMEVGGCTTLIGLELMRARQAGGGNYAASRQAIANATAPAPAAHDAAQRATREEIVACLQARGFVDGQRYVIINFRASGHSDVEKRIRDAGPGNSAAAAQGWNPRGPQVGGNHPELDTGTVGVQQLRTIVTDLGFVPVMMGEEPANAPAPNLIKYWDFMHAGQKICRGGRAAEAYFLRVLHEEFPMKQIAMRSGVTDQLAFLGIPTISIDLDNFHRRSAPELFDQPGYQLGGNETAHSWGRGGKLEAGMERDYGRVFLHDRRELKTFDAQGKWSGRMSDDDVARVKSGVRFYFGDHSEHGAGDAPASNGLRHSSHPLHPDQLDATRALGAPNEAALRTGLRGKIDTNLNPDAVLAHVRLLAGAPGHDAEIQAALDSHLEFTSMVGNLTYDLVTLWNNKQRDRIRFLRDAAALLVGGYAGLAAPYNLERTTIEAAVTLNTQRLGLVDPYVTAVQASYEHTENAVLRRFDPNDRRLATERGALAAIAVAPLRRARRNARAMAEAETSPRFLLQLRALEALAVGIQQQLEALRAAAAARFVDQAFYRRPFHAELPEVFARAVAPGV